LLETWGNTYNSFRPGKLTIRPAPFLEQPVH
jgi:hypothetical protein